MFQLPDRRILSSEGPEAAVKSWFSHGYAYDGHPAILPQLFDRLFSPQFAFKGERVGTVKLEEVDGETRWWFEPGPAAVSLMQRVDVEYLRNLINGASSEMPDGGGGGGGEAYGFRHLLFREFDSLDRSQLHHVVLHKQFTHAVDHLKHALLTADIRLSVAEEEHSVVAVEAVAEAEAHAEDVRDDRELDEQIRATAPAPSEFDVYTDPAEVQAAFEQALNGFFKACGFSEPPKFVSSSEFEKAIGEVVLESKFQAKATMRTRDSGYDSDGTGSCDGDEGNFYANCAAVCS